MKVSEVETGDEFIWPQKTGAPLLGRFIKATHCECCDTTTLEYTCDGFGSQSKVVRYNRDHEITSGLRLIQDKAPRTTIEESPL